MWVPYMYVTGTHKMSQIGSLIYGITHTHVSLSYISMETTEDTLFFSLQP